MKRGSVPRLYGAPCLQNFQFSIFNHQLTKFSVFPRVTESAGSPFGIVEDFDRFPFYLLAGGNDHLTDPFAIVDDKGFVRQIDEDNSDFPPIVGIDGTRRIQQGDSMFDGQSAPGTHLGLIAVGKSDIQACRDQLSFQGLELYRL